MNKNYPLSDSDMIYDFKAHRYILTEEHVLNKLGINLRARMGGERAINATAQINSLLDTKLSHRIYSVIYAHNDKRLLEYLLAKSESGRQIIMEAMEEQLLWMLTEDYSEEKWLSKDAYEKLLQPLDETGIALAYRVRYQIPRCVPNYEEGRY